MPSAPPRDLNDSQWAILNPLISEPFRLKDGRGRPWKSRGSVLNAILWVLGTGAPWADLPDHYPPYQKGEPKIGKTKRGKGTKIMAVADRSGLPVAVYIESGSPHEVKLVDSTLVQIWSQRRPRT